MSDEVIKKFMFLNRKAPHGTVYAIENLETVLISAMFDQDVHVAFMDDGVFQLRKGQNPAALEIKDFAKAFRALEGYGIEKLFVEAESLAERGMSAGDIMVEAEVISRADMTALIAGMDVVISA